MSERQKEARTRNWLLKMLSGSRSQCTSVICQSDNAGLSCLEAVVLEAHLKKAAIELEKAILVMRIANGRIHKETISIKEVKNG